jgi:hypothetical protein
VIEAIGSLSALRDNDFVRAGNDVRSSPLAGIDAGRHAIVAATVEYDLEAVVAAEGCGQKVEEFSVAARHND